MYQGGFTKQWPRSAAAGSWASGASAAGGPGRRLCGGAAVCTQQPINRCVRDHQILRKDLIQLIMQADA